MVEIYSNTDLSKLFDIAPSKVREALTLSKLPVVFLVEDIKTAYATGDGMGRFSMERLKHRSDEEVGITKDELATFRQTLEDKQWLHAPSKKSPSADPRIKRTDLHIIAGLLALLKEDAPRSYQSDAQIIEALQEWNPNTPGYSKRSLEGRFSAARRAIDSVE